jgi:hypothetical protein
MDWFKKHTDAIIVLTAIVGSMLWMNGKFNDIDNRFAKVERDIAIMRSELEKDIAVIKAVLIMKQILPPELATHGNDTGNR